jgi:transcriptional regulator with XRE-family HTH domain
MKSLVTYNVVPALSTWSDKLVPKLANQEYRHAYMAEGVKTWIARQVRALREQRDWSQGDLARESGKKQSAISRIEDPDYGQLTLQTLFDIAKAYDLPLLVQFVEWQDWLYRMEDVSTEALRKDSFDGDHLAALSNQQYLAGNESSLTTYATHPNAIAIYDVDSFAVAHSGISAVTRYYDWHTQFLDDFHLALENLEHPGDIEVGDDIRRSNPFNIPPIAGLIGHG